MINVSNYNNYKRDNYIIPAGSIYTIDFNGAFPNYYRLNNMSDVPLYCSTMSMPKIDFYDFRADGQSVANFTEPTTRTKLYVLNNSNTDAPIILTTWEGEFNPVFMAVSEITLNGDAVIETEGIIKGFANGVKLPSGTNNIGKVSMGADLDNAITDIQDKNKTISENLETFSGYLSNGLPSQLGDNLEAVGAILSTIEPLTGIQGETESIIQSFFNMMTNWYYYRDIQLHAEDWRILEDTAYDIDLTDANKYIKHINFFSGLTDGTVILYDDEGNEFDLLCYIGAIENADDINQILGDATNIVKIRIEGAEEENGSIVYTTGDKVIY